FQHKHSISLDIVKHYSLPEVRDVPAGIGRRTQPKVIYQVTKLNHASFRSVAWLDCVEPRGPSGPERNALRAPLSPLSAPGEICLGFCLRWSMLLLMVVFACPLRISRPAHRLEPPRSYPFSNPLSQLRPTSIGPSFTERGRLFLPHQSRSFHHISLGSSLGERPLLNCKWYRSGVIVGGGPQRDLVTPLKGLFDKERPTCTFWQELARKNSAPRICRLN